MLFLEHHGVTHPGKVRNNNEDSLLVGEGRDETLFVVADGIGGFEAGEVASSITIDVLKDIVPVGSLEDAIREANRRILAAAKSDERLSGMGTTVVALRFGGTESEPAAEISHVGDSRAYLLRDGELKPITEDHSLVAELVRSGDLTRDEASEHPQKNLITRALGAEVEVEVDTTVLPIRSGDRFILCSDGLSDMIPETRMLDLLTFSPEGPEKAAQTLVSAALEAGGTDNVTVVVVDVKEGDPPAEEPRRGDTQEMKAIVLEEAGARRRQEKPQAGDKRAEAEGLGRSLVVSIRVLAAVLVLVAMATPFYLWGISRFFLGFEEGEVVIYQGLPYEPLGYGLYQEVQRTGLKEPDVQARYRDPIENHKLYSSKEQVEATVRDLKDQEQTR
ncbi:MAG: Stp1/IreP family PP2C-type Ser/Thr phosphatase [Actinomycetota bacterium]|nr:Stp1/IreP family PP2C-type Ser/Thr phosphatase [Actinomycetota bacterium]MDQ3921899.1 Stp1/IreP family PP2C-type Ser/Thr phosphatase [Actinomycetota bacterium]